MGVVSAAATVQSRPQELLKTLFDLACPLGGGVLSLQLHELFHRSNAGLWSKLSTLYMYMYQHSTFLLPASRLGFPLSRSSECHFPRF